VECPTKSNASLPDASQSGRPHQHITTHYPPTQPMRPPGRLHSSPSREIRHATRAAPRSACRAPSHCDHSAIVWFAMGVANSAVDRQQAAPQIRCPPFHLLPLHAQYAKRDSEEKVYDGCTRYLPVIAPGPSVCLVV